MHKSIRKYLEENPSSDLHEVDQKYLSEIERKIADLSIEQVEEFWKSGVFSLSQFSRLSLDSRFFLVGYSDQECDALLRHHPKIEHIKSNFSEKTLMAIALSPNTDQSLLEKMAESENFEVCSAVVKNPSARQDLLDSLYKKYVYRIAEPITQNPSVSPDLLVKVMGGDHHPRSEVFKYGGIHPNCPVETLISLSWGDERYFSGAISNDSTPTEALENILKNGDLCLSNRVLIEIAKHPSLPYEFFKKYHFPSYAPLSYNLPEDQATKFLNDDDVEPRRMLASNLRVSADILYELSMDPESSVRYRVATNTNSSHDALSFLSVDPETDVRIGVAKNGATWVCILSELSKDSSPMVRQAVAENPNCPEEIMEFLCADPDEDVRRKTALNPTASYSIVKKLSNDESSKVRVAALRSPLISKNDLIECLDADIMALLVKKLFLPEDVLLPLEGSSSKKIREAAAENSNHPGFIQVLKDRPKESKWFKKKFRLSTPEEKTAIDADNFLYIGIEDVEKLLEARNDITKLLSLESNRNENVNKVNLLVMDSNWIIRLAAIRTGLLNEESLLKLSKDENTDVRLYASTVLTILSSERGGPSLKNEGDEKPVSYQTFEDQDLIKAIVKKIREQKEVSVSILDPVWGKCCRFDHLFFDEGVTFLRQIWNMSDWERFWKKVKKSGVKNACLVASSAVPPELLRIISSDKRQAVIYSVAENPETPPEVLLELIHNAPDLRSVVARNLAITSEIASKLKISGDEEILDSLSANQKLSTCSANDYSDFSGNESDEYNPETPYMAESNYDYKSKSIVLINKYNKEISDLGKVSESLIEEVSFLDLEIKEEISRNILTPPEILDLLAREDFWLIRSNVATHQNTKKETLEKLALDDGRGVGPYLNELSRVTNAVLIRSDVAKNKNTPLSVFENIIKNDDPKFEDVKYALLANKNVSKKMYDSLDKKYHLYDEYLAQNEGLTYQECSEILARNMGCIGSLDSLCENPAVSIEILTRLISNTCHYTREKAHENKKWREYTIEVLKKIKQDGSAYPDLLMASLEEPVVPYQVNISDIYRAIRVLLIFDQESDYSCIPLEKVEESLSSSDLLIRVAAMFNDKTTVADLKKMLKNGAGQLTPLVQWRIGELTKVENT
jgi:hypothetical protein